MNYSPKRFKYNYRHKRNRFSAINPKGYNLKFGCYGIQSLEAGRVSAAQIESARQTIVRGLKREGKLWIRIFPDYPISSKPLEVRMGKGKGARSYWASYIRKGTMLFEVDHVDKILAFKGLKAGIHKLPLSCQLIGF